MTLLDILINTEPREKSGQEVLRRFDYQIAWGIRHLLELYEGNEDFALAFEFHDDILVVNNSNNPDECRFYQVKTKKSGKWTLNALLKREHGENGLKSSIAGKMYDHIAKFGESVKEVVFVSNQPSNFLNIESENIRFCFAEATPKDFKEFKDVLKKECKELKDNQPELFHYELSELQLNNFEIIIRGRLTEFIERTCGDIQYNVAGIFKAIKDECQRKSRPLPLEARTCEQILPLKFVTRDTVNNWIYELRRKAAQKSNWQEVSIDLNDIPAIEKLRLRDEWRHYEANNFSQTDSHLALQRLIQGKLAISEYDNSSSLYEMVKCIFSNMRAEARALDPSLSDIYLKAGILFEIYANDTRAKFQTTHAKS